MKLKKWVLFTALAGFLALLVGSSVKFDPCAGFSNKECIVMPSFNEFFKLNFEICVISDTGVVDCQKVSR